MKFFACICIVLVLVSLSEQIPSLENCSSDFKLSKEMQKTCGRLVCHDDGSIAMVGCGVWQCPPETQIGYQEEDGSKPTPECCGKPICSE